MNSESLNSIFERIARHQHTEADISELRQALIAIDSTQVLQQLGRYNINIGQGEDIHIGDKIYLEWNEEALESLLKLIQSTDSLISTLNAGELKEVVCHFLEDIEYDFECVKLFDHRIQQPIVLKKQYIPIKVTLERRYKHKIETSWSYAESEAELKRIYALKGFDEEKQKEAIIKTQVNWKDVKDKHNKIIVLADPGMGKSTLLKMEAMTTARIEKGQLSNNQTTVDRVTFPLYIRLSDLARTEGSIIDAITILVKRDYPQSSVLLEKLLVQKLNNGKCLLLFDAWDEVPQKQRCSLLRKLDLFVEQFIERKSNQIILTSRIVGYRGSIMNGAKEVEIVPFNQWQKEKYIETWFANGTDYIDNSSISPQRLISELRQKPQISGLAQNPLLLSLICSLYQQKGLRLPARRCQLYRESLNYMLSKWQLDNRRSSGEEETWIIAKRRLLEFLAYQFTSEGKEWFWRKDLVDKTNQFLKSSSSALFEKANPDELIREMSEEDGIIQRLNRDEEMSENGYRYIFLHRTFQEYLTASYLNQKINSAPKEAFSLVKAYLWDFNWHEILSLLTGLMEDSSIILKAIIEQKDDIFWTQLLLAGRCLSECQNANNSLAKRIVDQIYELWRCHPDLNCLQSSVVLLGQSLPIMKEKIKADLQDSSWFDRRREIVVLGKIDSSEIIPKLLNFVHRNNRQNICILINLLEEINTLEAIHALVKLFDSAQSLSYKVPLEAALARTVTPDLIPDLIRLLESSCVNPELKPCIAGILGSIGDSNAVPVLTIALLNKQVGRNQTYYGSEVREAAARALGAIGDLSSVPDLIKALNDPYHSVRLNTIEALGKIRDIRAVQGLGRVLRYSRSSDIQISALKALAKIDLPQSDMVSILSILIDIFQRSNSVVKYSVVNALKDIGNTKSIPFLIEALLNETLEIRIVAAEALGQIGAQEAVPALIETLQHSENVLRYKAAEALGKIGAQEAVPALIMALQDTEKVVERTADTLLKPFSQSAVKSSIVEALGNIGTPETVPVLAKTLKDSSVKVRYNSAEALGKIGTLEVVSLLFRAIEDPHDYVKGVSAIALERVGNLRVLQKLIHCSDQIVYSKDVFPIFRKLFVKYHKAKVKFIPVYPPEGIRKIIQTFALGRFIK